jgi:uncharacterized protein YegL
VKIDSIPEIKEEAKPVQRDTYERKQHSYQTPEYTKPTQSRNFDDPVQPVKPEPRRHEELKPEPQKQESFRPVNNSRVKRGKLVVSLIVDNSSSLEGNRFDIMKQSLSKFADQIKNSEIASDLDLAVYGFDGFSPRVLKGYDGDLDIGRFDNGGIQVLGKTIELAMDELVERVKLYKSHNIDTHKPWLIVMSDGGAYGDLSEQVTKLKSVIRSKKLTYFPFCLSAVELDRSLDPLAKLKMFLKIRDNKFPELFNFLYNTLEERINTPEEVPMRLNKQEIAGFIAR